MKIIFALLIGLSFALAGCDKSVVPQKSKVAAARQKMSREAFTKLVMGQTDRVVLQKLGDPELNNNYGGQFGILWVYRGVTFDPANNQQDQFATVVFENGVVTKVVFK